MCIKPGLGLREFIAIHISATELLPEGVHILLGSASHLTSCLILFTKGINFLKRLLTCTTTF